MSPDTMRRVDRWVGRPLCFLLSLVARRRRGEQPKPQRLLFIALAELGALVLTYPAMQEARRRFPEAEQYFLTFEAGRPVLELMGFPPQNIVTIRSGGLLRFVGDTLAAVWRCRALGIDAAVNFEVYARFSTILAFLSGARWRAGFHRFREEGHYLGNLVTHRAVYSPHLHAATAYLGLVVALSEPVTDEPVPKAVPPEVRPLRFRFVPDEGELDALRQRLAAEGVPLTSGRRLILLNANASDLIAQRRWPVERYAELAAMLLRDPMVTIGLTGSPDERAQADLLASRIGGDRVVNLAGRTSLTGLLHLFCLADGLVTNDSGPAHFASAANIPTVVLYGPETPRIFGPIGDRQRAIWLGLACSPCVSVYNQKKSVCGDNRCMTGIAVAQVASALQGAMASPRGTSGAPPPAATDGAAAGRRAAS
ncbi:MAG: glycosyltransferase family 9 protein [Sneathiellaceae bacterium]